MARISPVEVRFVKDEFSREVPSPPHDALTPAERRAHIAQHPLSYLAVTRGPEDASPDSPETDEELLVAGKEALDRLLDEGVFCDLRQPAMYAIRLRTADHTQTGLLCGVWAKSRATGQLRAHEEVRGSRRDHLAKHLKVVGHQSSPVVVAHRPVASISAEIEAATRHEPVLHLESPDGLDQTIWEVDAGATERLVQALDGVPLYIIDGHHRTGASEVIAESGGPDAQWVLSAIFPEDEMRNYSHHRWMHVDDAEATLALIESSLASHRVTVHEVERRKHGQIGFYGAGRWVLAELPGAFTDTALDVLEPVRFDRLITDLGLGAVPMHYLPGTRSLADLAATVDGHGGMLCAMNPIDMDELFAVADAGQIMPPKSTYFSPKARSGVILRPVDQGARAQG
ncbi:MAG: DUF1015 family protein [Acidimicrobiales bacterium]|nr:DUF1015 family protein [Acidimicrobiales bacterium]